MAGTWEEGVHLGLYVCGMCDVCVVYVWIALQADGDDAPADRPRVGVAPGPHAAVAGYSTWHRRSGGAS